MELYGAEANEIRHGLRSSYVQEYNGYLSGQVTISHSHDTPFVGMLV